MQFQIRRSKYPLPHASRMFWINIATRLIQGSRTQLNLRLQCSACRTVKKKDTAQISFKKTLVWTKIFYVFILKRIARRVNTAGVPRVWNPWYQSCRLFFNLLPTAFDLFTGQLVVLKYSISIINVNSENYYSIAIGWWKDVVTKLKA